MNRKDGHRSKERRQFDTRYFTLEDQTCPACKRLGTLKYKKLRRARDDGKDLVAYCTVCGQEAGSW